MRDPHSSFDKQITDLVRDFSEAASLMLRVIVAFLRGNAGLDEATGAVDEASGALRAVSESWVQTTLPEIYAEGAREALDSPQTSDVAPESLSHDLHEQSLDLFKADLIARLSAATDNVSEDAKVQIREIGRRRISEAISGGVIDASQAMADELEKRSIVFTDKSGRKWDPGRYADAVIRTASAEVLNTGHLNTAAELGSKYVRVSDGKSDSDPPCVEADGQIWALGYAMANRIQHVNCRRSFAAVSSDYSGKVDRE